MNSYIDKIGNKDLKQFVLESINLYGSPEKTKESEKVCDYIYKDLTNKRIIINDTSTPVSDTLMAACYIHNLFFSSHEYIKNPEKEQWIKLFYARYNLEKLGSKLKVPTIILDGLFSTVENQLGQNAPFNLIKPRLGTPTENFADAVWIVKEYIK